MHLHINIHFTISKQNKIIPVMVAPFMSVNGLIIMLYETVCVCVRMYLFCNRIIGKTITMYNGGIFAKITVLCDHLLFCIINMQGIFH